MKLNLAIAFMLFFSVCRLDAQNQYRTITISMNSNSTFFLKKWKAEADSAFVILNKVFNSREFQDSLRKLTFINENYCNTNAQVQPFITGAIALDSLFKEPNVSWTLRYKVIDGALGSTTPGTYITTAYRHNITKDMPELSPAYRLAVNLCHEYFHQVNYCHTYDPGELHENYQIRPGDFVDLPVYNRDVTYRVGWIAYFLIKDHIIQY